MRIARTAFTLMELLVVITIIAVLASMLLPTINLIRQNARTTTCANNVRQLGAAALTYANDNEATLPPGITADSSASWYNLLAPYVNDTNSGTLPKAFKCPNAGIKGGSSHYTTMPSVFAQLPRWTSNPGARTYCANLAEVRPELALIFDGTQDTNFSNNTRQMAFQTSGYDLWLGSGLEQTVVVNAVNSPDGVGFRTAWRHRGNRCNYVFGDGHTKSYPYNQELIYRQLLITKGNRKWEFQGGP